MIQGANDQLRTITTVPTLLQADQRDIFDIGHDNSLESKVRFRFLVELSEKNIHSMQVLLKETANMKLCLEGRNPDLGVTLFPQMLVRDNEEVLFFTNPRTETSIIEKNDACLWTDCKPLVSGFTSMFEEFWRNSTGVREKIVEIETGKPAPKTQIFADKEIAKKRYNENLRSAQEEILIMTSSKGRVDFSKNMSELDDLAKKGIAIKIMAPIVNEDIDTAKELSKLCSVKHVPPNYLPISIIDGKHLFQFQKDIPKVQNPNFTPSFENSLYTSNPEYVQRMRIMLIEIWRNADPRRWKTKMM
jgi:hypothetical protein